jgi:hypothetical protein
MTAGLIKSLAVSRDPMQANVNWFTIGQLDPVLVKGNEGSFWIFPPRFCYGHRVGSVRPLDGSTRTIWMTLSASNSLVSLMAASIGSRRRGDSPLCVPIYASTAVAARGLTFFFLFRGRN